MINIKVQSVEVRGYVYKRHLDVSLSQSQNKIKRLFSIF